MMDEFFASYKWSLNDTMIVSATQRAGMLVDEMIENVDVLKRIFSCIDLTTLSSEDCAFSVTEFCHKVNQFENKFVNIPSVGAVCVFPVFSPILKSNLNAKGVRKAVVAGGFPASQTFIDIKVLEIKRCV